MEIMKALNESFNLFYKGYRSNTYLKMLFPIFAAVMFSMYYFPIIGVNLKNAFDFFMPWFEMYKNVNFIEASYVIGATLIFICALYDSLLLKGLFFIIYGFGIFISLIAVMGMRAYFELLIYLPHLFIILICISLIYKAYTRKHTETIPE